MDALAIVVVSIVVFSCITLMGKGMIKALGILGIIGVAALIVFFLMGGG